MGVDGDLARGLSELVTPGSRVALADGCGLPYALARPLSAVAARAGGVRLVLGWVPGPAPDLDPAAFADIRTVVGGAGGAGADRVRARAPGPGPALGDARAAGRSAAPGPAAGDRRPRRPR
ncbi:hypothetical protein [Pseudonocardia sp. ICBG162]|uniref:hypothetical protein n=1 Tax=Pseudonocardia sp. ICBG162 TaxID=2846761 RepID=UPI001CF6C105|nr:hypothetical protein [Pseudonocardia sp. ICBG162]